MERSGPHTNRSIDGWVTAAEQARFPVPSFLYRCLRRSLGNRLPESGFFRRFFRVIAGSLLLLSVPAALLVPYQVRLSNCILPGTVRLGETTTNRIIVELTGEAAGLAAIECRYPADPAHYGLKVRDVRYRDRHESHGTDWRRLIAIEYELEAGFTGRIGVAPVDLVLIGPDSGASNRVQTERLFLDVAPPDGTPFHAYLPFLAFPVLVIIILRLRRRSGALKPNTEDSGVVPQ